MHDQRTTNERPEPAIVRWADQLAPGGMVLDVAAGGGRHALLFAERGHPVVAVDRDVARLRELGRPDIEIVEADLEAAPWPLAGRTFHAVVVTNYLWRPLLATLVETVAPGGWLLYETFAVGNERYGRPRNPDFLLRSGELLEAIRGELELIEYGNGEEGVPVSAVRQRVLAHRRPTHIC